MQAAFLILLIFYPVSYKGETAVLILARGGSKGVRLKNLQTVGGVSLVNRAVHTAQNAGLNDITVSTENPLIALEAIKSGANIFHRSRITAADWAPSIWGAAEFIASRSEIKKLLLIQATSPFIRSEQIRNALYKLDHPTSYDCVFSVTRSFKLRWRTLSNGSVVPINFSVNARPRRQDWNGELIETGAFYIARRPLIEASHFQNNNCTVYETPQADSFEIDSHHDLQLANVLLNSNLVEKNK